MFDLLRLWSGLLIRLVRSRLTLLIENLALRQQLAVFKRQNSRPRLATADKIFWVLLLRSWSLWKTALIVVSPETVVRWHRAGFQLYWRLISRVRKSVGRRPVTKEIRELIFKMVAENPTWRAPRIHGELAMLGSMSLNAASPAGCKVLRDHPNRGSAGLSSYEITGKPSPRWTSSQFRR
jgi:hypothetical protein